MIFLTGDVHNMSLNVKHQQLLGATELIAADRYAKIAAEYGVRVTLFVSGRASVEEPDNFESLVKCQNVEIGGHTWDSFRHKRLHQVCTILYGSPLGPRWSQDRDIAKTIATIRKCTGKQILSWRSHTYANDRHTNDLLTRHGVKIVSNEAGPDTDIKRVSETLTSVPVNVMPDHEYVYHGEITPERRQQQLLMRRKTLSAQHSGLRFLREEKELPLTKKVKVLLKMKAKTTLHKDLTSQTLPFGDNKLKPTEWLDRLKEDIPAQIEQKGFATILAHPLCMEIFDDMATFTKLCQHLSEQKTHYISKATTLLQ